MTEREAGTVGRYMHRNLETLPPEATARIAAERMGARGIGSVLVEAVAPAEGQDEVAGIVTETDLVQKVLAERREPTRTTVAQVMTSPVLAITPDRPMLDAAHLMDANRVRHLCVRDGRDIVGLISVRDLVRHFVDAESGPVHALTDVYRPLSVLMRTALELIDRGQTVLATAQQMDETPTGLVAGTRSRGTGRHRDGERSGQEGARVRSGCKQNPGQISDEFPLDQYRHQSDDSRRERTDGRTEGASPGGDGEPQDRRDPVCPGSGEDGVRQRQTSIPPPDMRSLGSFQRYGRRPIHREMRRWQTNGERC